MVLAGVILCIPQALTLTTFLTGAPPAAGGVPKAGGRFRGHAFGRSSLLAHISSQQFIRGGRRRPFHGDFWLLSTGKWANALAINSPMASTKHAALTIITAPRFPWAFGKPFSPATGCWQSGGATLTVRGKRLSECHHALKSWKEKTASVTFQGSKHAGLSQTPQLLTRFQQIIMHQNPNANSVSLGTLQSMDQLAVLQHFSFET